jgi:carbamoyltransferase
MEFGPRALGARSILADPRDPAMRERLNAAVKLREAFRPFAPAVPLERAAEWFELEGESPYMLLTAPVRPEKRGLIPAVTHADGSARVQTVRREDHPEFHALLEAFGRATGCPVLVNTSFNQRGEPMVRSPLEAYACFRRSGLDALILGEFLLLKEKQADDGDRWIESFEDD